MAIKFRKVGRYFICTDQTTASAINAFLIDYSINRLDALGVSRATSLAAIKAVMRNKLAMNGADQGITLPVFGHLGFKVHRGYKLFDFNRSEVTKIFADGVSKQEAGLEIAASKSASAVSAAPRHISADVDLAWYREQYIRGTNAIDDMPTSTCNFGDYYPEIEKCLFELIDSQAPSVVPIAVHIERLANEDYLARWSSSDVGADVVEKISVYMERILVWLHNHNHDDGQQLQLVPVHGDFSLVNAINTDNGMRIIDWEGLTQGSLFSDIYNFLFVERYYGRASSDFVLDVADISNRYRWSLMTCFPKLTSTATINSTFMRRLYYAERLKLLLHRHITPNLVDVVLKSIAMFDEFDQEAGDCSS